MDLEPERLAIANDRRCRGRVRVAVSVGFSDVVIAALIRHELEHARQFAAVTTGDPLDLVDLYNTTIDVVLAPARGLPGDGLLYGWVPMEWDANAAASRFVRTCYGNERVDELLLQDADHAGLLRVAPDQLPDLVTVEDRMSLFIRRGGPQLVTRAIAAGRVDSDLVQSPSGAWDGGGSSG